MGPINKSLIANFSGKETSFFFKISPKVVFCTTVPEYGHNSICQKSDLTTFVSQVFNLSCPKTVVVSNKLSFPGVPIFVEHLGGMICNFTLILPYFQHWGGMNLDYDFVQVSKLSEDQKKVFTKNGTLFFPKFRCRQKKVFSENGTLFSRIQADTYAQMHTRVKLLGGMQM